MLASAATYLAYMSASSFKGRLPLRAQRYLARLNWVVAAVLFIFVYLYAVDVTCVVSSLSAQRRTGSPFQQHRRLQLQLLQGCNMQAEQQLLVPALAPVLCNVAADAGGYLISWHACGRTTTVNACMADMHRHA